MGYSGHGVKAMGFRVTFAMEIRATSRRPVVIGHSLRLHGGGPCVMSSTGLRAYRDKKLTLTVFSSNIMSTTLKLSDIVTSGY